jgi:hypothetical protein
VDPLNVSRIVLLDTPISQRSIKWIVKGAISAKDNQYILSLLSLAGVHLGSVNYVMVGVPLMVIWLNWKKLFLSPRNLTTYSFSKPLKFLKNLRVSKANSGP